MKELTVRRNDAGQRLDRFVGKAVPLLPETLLQKYIRIKRIKLNGKGAKRDTRLSEGDVLSLYINDEFFEKPREENAYLKVGKPRINIVYEDENIILADKKPGVLCHSAGAWDYNTLIANIQAYLAQKGEWDPRGENSFAPALCNRIDRNTGGIVIAAKTAEGLRVMNQKIKDRELEKYYLCVVHGSMSPRDGTLKNIILKDEGKKQVSVHHKQVPGGRTAVTRYRTLSMHRGLSLIECELITGRTHQIRAQFAAAGHPLLGDGKYGSQQRDKPYGRHGQALYSYKLAFRFTTDAGPLNSLNGRTWQVDAVDFVTEYFPEFCLDRIM